MRFHSQNLNEKRGGRIGSKFRNGRAWLHIGRYTLGWQWCILWGQQCHVHFNVRPDGEGTLGWSAAIPGFAFYFHLDTPWRGAWLDNITRRPGAKYGNERQIGLSIHDAAIWWDVWADQMERRSKDPKWRHGAFHFDDFLLGRSVYSKREIERRETVVPMPEGCYPATITLTEDTWKRPRWFPTRRLSANVEIPNGIPHAGKGENSWDCGDDATYGMGCAAETVEEAIGKVVASCLRDRKRYGHASTTPRKPVLAQVR
jgi:hypothetical protein